MRRIITLASTIVFLIAIALSSPAGAAITAYEAKNHIGKRQTVCDIVASTKYAAGSKGKPTFLNLAKPYPNHIFTVLIWGSDRPKFGAPPEIFYRMKDICVTGRIGQYKGIPQIKVTGPGQIKVQ